MYGNGSAADESFFLSSTKPGRRGNTEILIIHGAIIEMVNKLCKPLVHVPSTRLGYHYLVDQLCDIQSIRVAATEFYHGYF